MTKLAMSEATPFTTVDAGLLAHLRAVVAVEERHFLEVALGPGP